MEISVEKLLSIISNLPDFDKYPYPERRYPVLPEVKVFTDKDARPDPFETTELVFVKDFRNRTWKLKI